MILRVTPGQADQAGDDGDELGALHAGELHLYLHPAILPDGHHVTNLPKYVNNVRKDDVALSTKYSVKIFKSIHY